jgi:hypothetical protein
VFQPPSNDLETTRALGTTAAVRDSGLTANDSQESLNSDDVDLVRRFFELLAKWEERDRRAS